MDGIRGEGVCEVEEVCRSVADLTQDRCEVGGERRFFFLTCSFLEAK